MSDDYAPTDVGAPAEDTAPEGGTSETEAAPEPSYLDTAEYSGHHVRIKVDGEEVEVPLSEALQGYSRTQDYTRKTQALAEQQREAQFAITLQRALENNPQATLRLLQEQYAAEAPAEEDDAWLDDPVETRLREYDQRLAQAEAFRADQELRSALRVLHQRYGEDFDPNEVVNRAAQLGRMDLEGVYKEIAFEKMWTQRQAQNEVEQRRSAEDASRVAAKSQVAAHTGGSANGAVEPSAPITSLSDAYYQAKRELGL